MNHELDTHVPRRRSLKVSPLGLVVAASLSVLALVGGIVVSDVLNGLSEESASTSKSESTPPEADSTDEETSADEAIAEEASVDEAIAEETSADEAVVPEETSPVAPEKAPVPGPAQVSHTVPSLQGQTVAAALETLRVGSPGVSYRLVDQQHMPVEAVDNFSVKSTSPDAGATLAPGQALTIVVGP